MNSHLHEKQTKTLLPIQIRYRAQDYETRYLDDPRHLYIEEFHTEHADDGFFAFIPSETAAKTNLGSKWTALGCVAFTIAALSWIAYRLISLR